MSTLSHFAPLRRLRFCIALILLSIFCATARADEQWLLTTADFHSATVSIESIDATAVHLSTGDSKTVPLAQVLELDRVGLPRSGMAKLFLLLDHGDQIGGNPLRVSGESLVWRNPALGELTFPLKQVRAMQRLGHLAPLNNSASTEDVLTLANGDTLRGIVSDISASTVTIQSAAGETTAVPVDSVNSADFAQTPSSTTLPGALRPAFRISMSDATIVTTPSITLAGRELRIGLPGAGGTDGADRPIPLSSIASIEQINGPVVWLSSCQPKENVQIPYFGDHQQPAQMNKTVHGDSIRIGDREFSHGIGVHSYSRLQFPLDPGFKTFRTQFAIDGEQPCADVTVRVKLDDRVAYEKKNVTSSTGLSEIVQLDLNGAKTLTLEVDYGENYDVQDRLNWIEPALLRGG